jgi:ribosome maturation factor RimP
LRYLTDCAIRLTFKWARLAHFFVNQKQIKNQIVMESADDSISQRIGDLVRPVLSALDLELVAVDQRGMGRRTLLRIFIDKPGGVTLGDCEAASRNLEKVLDVEDVFPGAYTLEVSSPGLDRPLKTEADYARAAGKRVRLKLAEPREGQWVLSGNISSVNDGRIVLETGTGAPFEVAFDQIRQGRLEVEWR